MLVPIRHSTLSDGDVGHWNTYGSRQTLRSQSDSVLCLLETAHARFTSDTKHCLMVTPKSVFRTRGPDRGSLTLVCDVRAKAKQASTSLHKC